MLMRRRSNVRALVIVGLLLPCASLFAIRARWPGAGRIEAPADLDRMLAAHAHAPPRTQTLRLVHEVSWPDRRAQITTWIRRQPSG